MGCVAIAQDIAITSVRANGRLPLTNMTELNNAVILITGATGGFGQELTKQLLQAGSQLILSDINQAGLEEYAALVSQEITTGKIIACIESNLASQEGCQTLFTKVQALNTPVDILINI